MSRVRRLVAAALVVVGLLSAGPSSAEVPSAGGLELAGAAALPPRVRLPVRIGVVSDTHGVLSGRVLDLLAGVDLILHAGDVGDERVLDRLGAVAPVVAVAGNSDLGPLGAWLRGDEALETPAGRIWMTHILPGRSLPGDARVVVFGHTHAPFFRTDGGVTLCNPGSASEGRGAPATVAVLTMEAGAAPRVEFFCVESGERYEEKR